MKKLIAIIALFSFFININAQCPTYSINSSSGNFTLGCNPSRLNINVVNTSTIPIYDYKIIPNIGVTSSGSNAISASYNFSYPGTYTLISDSSPFSFCQTTQTITIYPNVLAPNVSVSPLTATVPCGGSVTFSATCNPTLNVSGTWYQDVSYFTTDINHVTLCPFGTAISFSTGTPGTYFAVYNDNLNKCSNLKEVNVTSSQPVPSIVLQANPNCFLPCSNYSIAMGGWNSSTLAPTSQTWTNLSTSVSSPFGYTITTPGYYEYDFIDGNFCKSSLIFYIGTSTITPIINITGNNNICSGFSTTLTATGATNYTWSTGATTNTVNISPTSTSNYTITSQNGSCTGFVVTTVSVNVCTGINEGIEPLNSLKVFPNPASNTLYISDEQYFEAQIEIINTLGETILKTPFINEIDVSGLPDGIYTLQLISKNQIVQKRLIISR
ncbi:MAG TPA: T9SS type A sorting domain-containing protein [Bacteroidia bacterium]|jgi:hypothetical protein|nr:T9SS type A sorting domain-containing protein [Bacteroidia bacterium]